MGAAVMLMVATLTTGRFDSTNYSDSHARARIESPPRRIWLQVVPAAPTSRGVLETMIAATAAIWAPYDVIVTPIFTLSRPDDRECQWITLILRRQPANRIDGKEPRGYRALASLGFTAAGPDNVMYASLDTARHLVEGAGLGSQPEAVQERLAAELLGRAISHELGHYLLRSAKHSKTGLMKASLGTADVMSRDLGRFRLLPEQAAALPLAESERCLFHVRAPSSR
ncbi:MAG TPA: hypothetical protein VFO14_08535 [Vicinamibacterales bacterium]|nr:hypothetical protein [Vicinamibacterales bacterium]